MIVFESRKLVAQRLSSVSSTEAKSGRTQI